MGRIAERFIKNSCLMPSFAETTIENAVLEYLAELGREIVHGSQIAPEEDVTGCKE